MTRRKFIAGNWKMNKDVGETVTLLDGILRGLRTPPEDTDLVVCPPFPSLERARTLLAGSIIRLGAQNMSQFDNGAYTGETSAKMLLSLGCEYVILGHSERRQHFFETDSLINLKVVKALESGLIPIICVGETLDEREGGRTAARIESQIEGVLRGLSEDSIHSAVIAYEPVWAIGTGKTATTDQAQEVHHQIRSLLEKQTSRETAESVRIIYGGSLNPKNAPDLFRMKDIDGGLIGGASLQAESFLKICQSTG